MRCILPTAANWISRSLLIGLTIIGPAGCGEDEAVDAERISKTIADSRVGAIVLKSESPDVLLSMKGQIRDDGKGGIVWETPGAARLTVEVPCAEPIDLNSIWTNLYFKGAKGEDVAVGNVQPEAAKLENGTLTLAVEHAVLAKFQTHGKMSLQIEATRDGETVEIANVPFRGTTE